MNILGKNENHSPHNKPSLSATSILTYMDCPLQYKYRYVDKIPGAPEKPNLILGNVIHKVLELFHKKQQSSFDELMKLLEKHWQEGGYKYKQEQEQNHADAEKMLTNYWNYIKFNVANTLYTEYCFSFDTQYANLNGKCDRIDLDNENKISIIDYKTSKSSMTERELKKNIQLGIYFKMYYWNF